MATLREFAAPWGLAFRNLVFPQFCKQCRRRLLTEENGFFCPECWEKSPRVERPFCIVCGRPHRGAVGFGTQSNFPCAGCRSQDPKRRPFRRIYGAGRYAEAVEEAVKLFKFYDRPRLARPLGELMREFAVEEMDPDAYDLIIPVPLHATRLRHRGYNQAELLARELSEAFPAASLAAGLVRTRPTRVQSRLKTEAERRANVRGAFSVAGPNVTAKRILLVDDVVTTGGTVKECARVLRKAGASYVDIFAAALAVAPAEGKPRGAQAFEGVDAPHRP